MVTVKAFQKRQSKDGKEFISLELVGGLELIQSSNSGKFYATVRKCFIPATFDETIATKLVGTQIKGEIVRIPCEPYDFISPTTGEVMTLQHSYGYEPSPSEGVVHSSRINEFAEA